MPFGAELEPGGRDNVMASHDLVVPASSARSPRQLHTVAIALAAVLAIYVGYLVQLGVFSHGANGRTMAVDAGISIAAATVLQHGENPYDPQRLFLADRRFLLRSHVPPAEVPSLADTSASVRRVGNPPLFFAALEPFTGLDFRITGIFAVVALYLLLFLGALLTLRAIGWRRVVWPSLLALAMPPALFAGFYANSNVLVFLGIALGLALCARWPWLAGASLSLAWIKLTLGVPFVLLILLFHTRQPRRVLMGFAAASLAELVLTLAVVGLPPLGWWVHGLFGYSSDMAAQADLASLTGAYGPLLPAAWRTALEAGLLLLAVAATGATWLRASKLRPLPVRPFAWLWVLWFLCLPFAHFHDAIVLLAPVAAVLGPDARYLAPRIRQLLPGGPGPAYPRAPFFLLYAVFLVGRLQLPLAVNLVPVPLLLVLLCCWWSRRDPVLSSQEPYSPRPEAVPAS